MFVSFISRLPISPNSESVSVRKFRCFDIRFRGVPECSVHGVFSRTTKFFQGGDTLRECVVLSNRPYAVPRWSTKFPPETWSALSSSRRCTRENSSTFFSHFYQSIRRNSGVECACKFRVFLHSVFPLYTVYCCYELPERNPQSASLDEGLLRFIGGGTNESPMSG